ncbi:MAG: hypothetical protein HYV34_00130 [Candidatus Kerfeldbacteria bacterium]|nr:hypothetical protein [Candidatus Kerfeldbacteria bacterium]
MQLSRIRSIPWLKQKERDFDIALESIYIQGFRRKYFQKYGFDFSLDTIAKSDGKIYFDARDMEAARSLFLKKGKGLAAYANKLTQRFLKSAKDYETFLAKHADFPYNRLLRRDLRKVYNDDMEHLYRLIPYSFLISVTLEDVACEIIPQYLSKVGSKAVALYMQLMVAPKLNRTAEEYRARLRLAQMFQKTGSSPQFKRAIQNHRAHYDWMVCYAPFDALLTEEALVEDIRKLAVKNPKRTLRLIEQTRNDSLHEAKRIFREAHLPAHIGALVRVMQQNVWVRTYRRELMSYGFAKMRPMYQAIAGALQMNLQDFPHTESVEIAEMLVTGKRLSAATIRTRSKDFAFVQLNDTHVLLAGVRAKRLTVKGATLDATDELHGRCAFPGSVQGSVTVIRKAEELHHFRKGDILVAFGVNTWMMPIIQKCSAIVTEEGGVLTHIANIAREYRKPCIVGVKGATSVLRTGDSIEVNADVGTVKKLQ